MKIMPYRKTKRLKGFDYTSSNSYFITICSNQLEHYFGEVKNHFMFLNEAGCMLYNEWRILEKSFRNVIPQEFIVMPNHIHGIIEIQNYKTAVGAHPCNRPSADEHKVHPCGTQIGSLGRIVQAYKSRTTVEYIKTVKAGLLKPFSGRLWQTNYYEHIIRDEKDYEKIAGYIINNPVQWHKDEVN